MITNAMQYLERGWSVIPLSPHDDPGASPGKRPLIPWEDYQKKLPTKDQIAAWWQQHAHANIGIIMGPVSDLIGLDVDGDAGTKLLLDMIGEKTFPETLEFMTPGNGVRLLFKWSGNNTKITSLKVDGKEAVRLLTTGSQTAAPPSIHVNGGIYQWRKGYGPGEIEPAEIPEWLLEGLTKPPIDGQAVVKPSSPKLLLNGYKSPVARATAYLQKCDPAISGSGGHDQTFKIACKLIKGFALSIEDAFTLMMNIFNPTCLPPWTEKEIRHKLESASKTEGKTGYMLTENLSGNLHKNGNLEKWKTDAEKSVSVLPLGGETETDFPDPVIASKLTAKKSIWLVNGFIGEKSITLLSALWKVGKTTWLTHLLRAIEEGEDFCGQAVSPATILYISEESETRWANRRDNHHIGDNVYFLCRPFKLKPTAAQWEAFLLFIAKKAKQIGATLVIFDTISAFWPVRDENDATVVQSALMPLWHITEVASVLLTHHLKKSDGFEATGSRGSGALPSFVDTIMELRRYDPSDQKNRKRVITSYGRDEETPPELVIELSEDGKVYISHGTKEAVSVDSILTQLLSMLPTEPPGYSFDEIKENWPEDCFPTKSRMNKILKDGIGTVFNRDGKGVSGDPYTYHKLNCSNN